MIGIAIFFLRFALGISMIFLIPWWEVILITLMYLLTKWVFFHYVFGLDMLDSLSSAYHQSKYPNTSQIVGSCILERCDISAVEATFKKLVCLPGTQHFRKRVVHVLGNYYFMDEKDFSVGMHIRVLNTNEPIRDMHQLVQIMGNEMLLPLNPRRAPWEVIFIPQFMDHSAFFWKVDHTLGDGVALQYLFTHSGDAPPLLMQRFSKKNWIIILTWVIYPIILIIGLIYLKSRSRDKTPLTRYKNNPLSGQRATAYAGPYQLSQLKRVCHRFGTTINNLLLSNVLASLREYFMLEHGEDIHKMNIGLPVNYRWTPTPDRPLHYDNKFILFVQKFPLKEINDLDTDSIPSFNSLVRITGSLMNPYKLRMGEFNNYINDLMPHRICLKLAEDYNDTTGLVFTNIAGSRRPISFKGHRVLDILYLAPSIGQSGANICIVSYADRISVLSNSDLNRLRNPKRYIQIFKTHLDAYFDKYEGGVQYSEPTFQMHHDDIHCKTNNNSFSSDKDTII